MESWQSPVDGTSLENWRSASFRGFESLTFRQDGRRVANRVCNPFCFQPQIMRSLLRVLSGGAAVENVSKNTGVFWEIPGCMGG